MSALPNKKNNLLKQFNTGLLEMRELFHETGRLEDSNSKLDEITKLLCLEIASIRDPASEIPSIGQILDCHRSKNGLVRSLNKALLLAGKSNTLTNYDGESLLGPNPKFNIAESEDILAKRLAQIVLNSFNGYLRDASNFETFEFLNEAFGHFIRENFRQNIEDAQYMTPSEAVNYMVGIGIHRLMSKSLSKNEPLVICDPSCGVGSFLAQFYRAWHISKRRPSPLHLVGQDKVDRMARLSLLNLSLFGIDKAHVSRGNSLYPGSPLDNYIGKCDLILTNPPFGARFSCSELGFHSATFFPLLNNHIQFSSGYLDSELLFLDLYLSLLKEGGTVLAVVPDSIISSSGIPAILRDGIQKKWTIRSITELPAATFAQAGTRTKTCILELEKLTYTKNIVLMGKAQSLGFEVSSKKGVPYKKSGGHNDLIEILNVIREYRKEETNPKTFDVISVNPSCVSVDQAVLLDEGWTPSHYSSERLTALQNIEELANSTEFEVRSLDSIVTVASHSRRGLPTPDNSKCISILHVGDFGSFNMREFMEYVPKTPGKPCIVGDLLFSKINPRIPRALVIPELPFSLTCSTEFEVFNPKAGFTAHEIMLLLLSDYAQKQIQSLTSGTSSSHNRIKTKGLLSIKVLIPKKGTKQRSRYDKAVEAFTFANTQLNKSNIQLQHTWREVNNLITI